MYDNTIIVLPSVKITDFKNQPIFLWPPQISDIFTIKATVIK